MNDIVPNYYTNDPILSKEMGYNVLLQKLKQIVSQYSGGAEENRL